jgi:putative ABC transport system substrate-binding protein
MRRREFITLLGGAAAAWPLAARAQQAAMPVIGFLGFGSLENFGPWLTAFRKGLNEGGFVEGQNVAIEYRWADGQYDRMEKLASDLVGRRVAVIAVPGSPPGARAAKAATSRIPIVFGIGEDPVKLGLVASIARPGGNATGVNFLTAEVIAKRLALLLELVPGAARVAALINPTDAVRAEAVRNDLQSAVRTMGVQLQILNASSSLEIDAALAAVARERADALFVGPDAFFNTRRVQLANLGAHYSIPTAFAVREYVDGRPHELRNECRGHVSSGRHLYRQHSQRREACRSTGAAIDQVGTGYQRSDGKNAPPRCTIVPAQRC